MRHDRQSELTVARDRIETLIGNLREKPVTGTKITDFERILLPELVDQCWGHVTASEATLRNTSTLLLQVDTSSLKRVLENLLRNAIEHNDGDLRVEVGDLDGADGFYATDDGRGTPEHARGSVFEPGVSTGRDESRLGRSIVARFVEAHDWQTRVSESEVGGARFEIADHDRLLTESNDGEATKNGSRESGSESPWSYV